MVISHLQSLFGACIHDLEQPAVSHCAVLYRTMPRCTCLPHSYNTHRTVPDPTAIKLSLGPLLTRERGTLTPATHRSRNGLRERTLICFFLDGIVSTKPISTVAHAATVAIALGVVKQCAAPQDNRVKTFGDYHRPAASFALSTSEQQKPPQSLGAYRLSSFGADFILPLACPD